MGQHGITTLSEDLNYGLLSFRVMADDPRLYMRIYRELKDKITTGKLESNRRLNMGEIAANYEVNRDTVRVAFGLLADEQLITRWPGIGWVVN